MQIVDAIKAFKNKVLPRDRLPGVLSIQEQQRLQSLPQNYSGSTNVLGIPIKFSDSGGFLHSLQEIFVEEVYRFEATSLAPIVIDLGANIGLSVLYFKRLFPDALVLAYEPDPDIFPLLMDNCRRMGEGIVVKNAAAWVSDCQLDFYKEGSLAGSSEIDANGVGNICSVKAERLRDALIAYESIDFLKVDIEGAENEVMFDLEDILPKVKNLFLEYHGIPHNPQRLGDLLNLISRAGFRYTLRNANPCIHLPFVEDAVTAFDPQLNVFCHRRF